MAERGAYRGGSTAFQSQMFRQPPRQVSPNVRRHGRWLVAKPCKFVHAFEDLSEGGMLSVDLNPPAGAVIQVDLEEGGKVCICAELGLGQYEPGYHIHRDLRFGESDGSGPEVTFEVRGEAE
jgi:hypothetical protein